jgi:hypothetical protein
LFMTIFGEKSLKVTMLTRKVKKYWTFAGINTCIKFIFITIYSVFTFPQKSCIDTDLIEMNQKLFLQKDLESNISIHHVIHRACSSLTHSFHF